MKIDLKGLMGVPFLDHGRDPGEGLDCIGLFIEVYRRAGIDLSGQDCEYRSGQLDGGILLEELPRRFEEVPCATERGDIALVAEDGPNPQHLAIALGGGRFVHARRQRGVSTVAWSMIRSRVTHCFRLRQVS